MPERDSEPDLCDASEVLHELTYQANWELAPVVQTIDSAVHRINHYPVDKHYQNQLSYPVDSDLSRG